jgi:ankyrin repeat protein
MKKRTYPAAISTKATNNHSTSLQSIPFEVLELIFIESSSSSLHRVSRVFHKISQSPSIRAKWLLKLYGNALVLSLAWNFKFLNSARNLNHELVSCKCKKHTALSCIVEESQLHLIQILLNSGADPLSGNSQALKMAAKSNHLRLSQYLLQHGSSRNASVAFKRTWLKTKPKLGGSVIRSQKEHEKLYPVNFSRNLREVRERLKIEQVDLLLQACQNDNVDLVRLLISSPQRVDKLLVQGGANESETTIVDIPDEPDADKISDDVESIIEIPQISIYPIILSRALNYCLLYYKDDLARILIEAGGQSTVRVCYFLMQRAGAYRLGLKNKDKFLKLLPMSIGSLNDRDFDRMGQCIIRGCSEVGSIDGIKVAIERGADINVGDGLVLYSAVYSGNDMLLEYLVTLPNLNINYFNRKKKVDLILIRLDVLLHFDEY